MIRRAKRQTKRRHSVRPVDEATRVYRAALAVVYRDLMARLTHPRSRRAVRLAFKRTSREAREVRFAAAWREAARRQGHESPGGFTMFSEGRPMTQV